MQLTHLIDNGVFNPSDPLMRKLGIATLACEGLLRNPISMDFLIPRDSADEIAMLRQDLEVNISRDLLAQYTDERLSHMIATVRKAVQTLYPLKVPVQELAKPLPFEEAVSLTKGEKVFLDGIFKGKNHGSGSPIALIQATALFSDINQPSAEIIRNISHDMGILSEVEQTNRSLREKSTINRLFSS